MDFSSLVQHIDMLLEQEQIPDAQNLIDKQITSQKYTILTAPTQEHLHLWEEKWQLQLLLCKSLSVQFKPNEAVYLADNILEESRVLDEYTSKIQVKAMTAKVPALLLLGHIQECQQLILEVENRIKRVDPLSLGETNNLQVILERSKGYLNNIFGNFELALTQLQNSLRLSRQNENNAWSVGAALILEGQIYGDMGQLSKGLELLQKSVEYNNDRNLEYNYIWSTFILAMYHFNRGEYKIAEKRCLESLELSKGKETKLMIAWIQNTLGASYYQQGKLTDALSNLIASYQGFKSANNRWSYIPASFLGQIFRLQGKYEQALPYLKEALEGVKSMGFQAITGYRLNALGEVYRTLNQIDEARSYFEQALEINNLVGNQTYTSHTLFNLFLLHLETNQTEEAYQQVERLKRIADEEKNPTINDRTILADALYQMRSTKLLDKAQAQQKLREFIQQQDIAVDLLIMAYLNLFELHLIEWKVSEDEAALDEINTLLNQMDEIAENQSILPLEVELHLLRALLTLVQGNLSLADSQVSEAIHISQTHEFTNLLVKSQELQTKIQSQVKEWQDLLEENVSIKQLLEKTEMEEYLKTAMRIKYSKD